jgi:hypothetical protein
MQPKREPPKTQSLQSMVTLGGKSLLYLPPEFAPRALVLPTCFRATAQYLVQNGGFPAIVCAVFQHKH